MKSRRDFVKKASLGGMALAGASVSALNELTDPDGRNYKVIIP